MVSGTVGPARRQWPEVLGRTSKFVCFAVVPPPRFIGKHAVTKTELVARILFIIRSQFGLRALSSITKSEDSTTNKWISATSIV